MLGEMIVHPMLMSHYGMVSMAIGTIVYLVNFGLALEFVLYNFRMDCSLLKLSLVVGIKTPTLSARSYYHC